MSVSVLTLVKDRETHLLNLVEGLARSANPPGELVIVDMSTRPIATPEAAFPVRMVHLETQGLALATARNRAAEVAVYDQLVFLDVDCIPSANLLTMLSSVLEREDALVCADVRYLPAGAADPPWTEAGLLAAGLPHPVRAFPTEGVRREANAGLFWSLAFGLRRATFMGLGGFDEGFHGYGAEDTDFGFRARAADVPLLFVGGALAFHQHHGVFDPPLQHFQDIVANAKRFHDRWTLWPMEGWLSAFADLGLITLTPSDIIQIRTPSEAEIEAARRPASQAF